jgi:hypothetical protein
LPTESLLPVDDQDIPIPQESEIIGQDVIIEATNAQEIQDMSVKENTEAKMSFLMNKYYWIKRQTISSNY